MIKKPDISFNRTFASSVFVKATALIAFTSIVLVAAIMYFSNNMTAKITVQGVKVLAKEVTTFVATDMKSALRFNNTADIHDVLNETIEKSEGMAVYGIVTDPEGNILAQLGEENAGHTHLETLANVATQTGEYSYTNDGLYAAAPIYFGAKTPKVIGALAIIWSSEQAKAYANQQKRVILAKSLGLLAMMLVISALLLRQSVSKPLVRACIDLKALENSDFSKEIENPKRKDEIGQIFRHVGSLKTALKLAEDERKEVEKSQMDQTMVVEALTEGLQSLADGDLSQLIEKHFPPEYEKLKTNFNTTTQSLRSTIEAVIESTSAIRDGSMEMSQSSDDLSQRTETQAATLEETAAALDQITASVKSAASGAKEVENIVTKATVTAENGQGVVRSAVVAMAEIEESSKKISQIISVIDDIAFQTNLLALNAGVEAARAGEAGRGFAVVASEVRALAQRSSEAAKEIKGLIRDSSLQVDQGVKLVDGAGDELQKIVTSVENIANLIGDIATGSIEQSAGITEINLGVTNLDQVTQQNAAMVQEATAACFSLNSDAQQLAALVARFNTGPDAHEDLPTPQTAQDHKPTEPDQAVAI